MWLLIFTKSLPISSMDYVPYTVQRFAVSYEIKQTALGLIQLHISQVLRVYKDVLLDLFSSSAVQMENHSVQFLHLLFRRPNSLNGFAL